MDENTDPTGRSNEAVRAAPGGDSRRPFRLWMTGSLAVVMAALVPALVPVRSFSALEIELGKKSVRHSRYGVTETVQRLQAAAFDQGLSVLALLPGARPVLVLASSAGGTLVVMDRADSRPEMPFSMMIREGAAGGAEVLVPTFSGDRDPHDLRDPREPRDWRDWRDWRELPAGVADDLRALPGVVERALA